VECRTVAFSLCFLFWRTHRRVRISLLSAGRLELRLGVSHHTDHRHPSPPLALSSTNHPPDTPLTHHPPPTAGFSQARSYSVAPRDLMPKSFYSGLSCSRHLVFLLSHGIISLFVGYGIFLFRCAAAVGRVYGLFGFFACAFLVLAVVKHQVFSGVLWVNLRAFLFVGMFVELRSRLVD